MPCESEITNSEKGFSKESIRLAKSRIEKLKSRIRRKLDESSGELIRPNALNLLRELRYYVPICEVYDQDLGDDIVDIGSTVVLKFPEGDILRVLVCSPTEAKVFRELPFFQEVGIDEFVSYESPLGFSLLGAQPDSGSITYKVQGRDLKVEILGIEAHDAYSRFLK